jgi:hypothetical protein
MSAVALLKRAKDAGVTLWTDGGAIHYRGPRDALAWLVPELKAHKPAILAAIACPAADLIQKPNSTTIRTSPYKPKSAGSPTMPRLS